jgi:hypothetical protein
VSVSSQQQQIGNPVIDDVFNVGIDQWSPIIFQQQQQNDRSHFGWSLTLMETGTSERRDKNHW